MLLRFNNIKLNIYKYLIYMIQKSGSSSEPHAHFDDSTNGPHKLLFERKQKIYPDEYECTIVNYLGVKTQTIGKIIMTDFRVIFKTSKQKLYQQQTIKFDFPIGYLSRCEGSSQVINKINIFYVQFQFKFGFVIRIKSTNSNLTKVTENINSLMNQYDSFGQKRAQDLNDQQKCKKWEEIYNQKEGAKLQQAVTYDNQAWKYLPLYPQIFKVPKPFVGKRSQHDRLVLLSYVHDGKRPVGLWRSGPGKPDADEQKWVPSAAKKQDHIVVQIKTKSVGTNKSLAQQMLQVDGPVQLRQSFMKFFIASCYQNQQQQQQQRWLIHANFSKWYQQIEILMSQAFLLLGKLCQGVNITILSDWDVRGSQICALVQVLAKPENRTINGFGKLIQKQFLHYGNYTIPSSRKDRVEDKGIALIQFLDCVYQIIKMYPLSFQFNEDMLTYIAIHIYSRKYGNFLYITRSTTELNQQKFVKYGCIWAKIQKFKQQFMNPFFVDHRECDIYELRKNVGMKNYSIWSTFFLRDILMYSNNIEINQINSNQRVVWKRHCNTKNEAQLLRIKLVQQHKLIVQKRKKLKELQRMQL